MAKIQIPKAVMYYPDPLRKKIIPVLAEAAKLPAERTLYRSGASDKDMWARNEDELMADAEDELYERMVEAEARMFAVVYTGLGLPLQRVTLTKSFAEDLTRYGEERLEKSKDSGRNRMSRWIKQLAKQTKDKFIKWADGRGVDSKVLDELDRAMIREMPDFRKEAEAHTVRAGFIGKIRNKADREMLDLTGAVVDSFPSTIKAAEKTGVALTKAKAMASMKRTGAKSMTIQPLSPKEREAVDVAYMSAADKLTNTSSKHREGVRALVVQAKRERWSAQELASRMFDKFGEHNRDWRRVAITELAYANNDAFLAGLEEGQTLIGMGAVDACPHCRRHVIGKQVTFMAAPPRKETFKTDTEVVWVGKSNYGRKVAEYRSAVPVHPHCRCRWHALSRFYKVERGKAVLKTTAELINEEREKMGLPEDKNIVKDSKLSLEELSAQVLKKLEGEQ